MRTEMIADRSLEPRSAARKTASGMALVAISSLTDLLQLLVFTLELLDSNYPAPDVSAV
jgi:hypothetical protein